MYLCNLYLYTYLYTFKTKTKTFKTAWQKSSTNKHLKLRIGVKLTASITGGLLIQ